MDLQCGSVRLNAAQPEQTCKEYSELQSRAETGLGQVTIPAKHNRNMMIYTFSPDKCQRGKYGLAMKHMKINELHFRNVMFDISPLKINI